MSDTKTVHDPFLNKDVQVGDKLTDRLRGRYACGPHLPNGNPEFGWRQFEAPPIQHEAAAEIERLTAERDEARKIVADVNNSVFGSQAYFTTPCCVDAVENLKQLSNRSYHASQAAEAKLSEVTAERDQFAQVLASPLADEVVDLADKLFDTRKVLEDVLADIKDYERVNNLAPNPGRTHCWDSVARAYALLAQEGKS